VGVFALNASHAPFYEAQASALTNLHHAGITPRFGHAISACDRPKRDRLRSFLMHHRYYTVSATLMSPEKTTPVADSSLDQTHPLLVWMAWDYIGRDTVRRTEGVRCKLWALGNTLVQGG